LLLILGFISLLGKPSFCIKRRLLFLLKILSSLKKNKTLLTKFIED
jgi:hypothetical protein